MCLYCIRLYICMGPIGSALRSVFKNSCLFCGLDLGNLKFETVRTNKQQFAFRIWDAQFEILRFEIMKTDRNGVTANLFVFDRGTFGVLPLTFFDLPKSARAYLSLQSDKILTFAAAPWVLTPFVRNQGARPLLRLAQNRRGSGGTTCLTRLV